MSRRKLYSIVGGIGALATVAALAVALTLVFTRGGAGPVGSSPGPVASAVVLAQASGVAATSGALPSQEPGAPSGLEAAVGPAPSGSGPGEGIKVHGHWTIEVREPDGTLVSRTELQNALRPEGATALSQFLARTSFPGFWRIGLGPPAGQSQPCGSGAPCFIIEPNDPLPASSSVFKNLTVAVPAAGQNNGGKLVLSGNATAQANTSIGIVDSETFSCPSSTPCNTASVGFTFTLSSLSSPVAVTTGQVVSVTVVIGAS
jgi:hypothetical protein